MRGCKLICLSALALAGCVSGPNYAPPPPPKSAALQSGVFLRAGEVSTAQPQAQWWLALGDPELNALVDQGLRDSPTVEAAAARVRQARAGLGAARANLLPSIGGSGLYAHADLPAGSLGG